MSENEWTEWVASRSKYASREEWYDARPAADVAPISDYPKQIRDVIENPPDVKPSQYGGWS